MDSPGWCGSGPFRRGLKPAGVEAGASGPDRASYSLALEASSSARIFSTSGRKVPLIAGEHDASLMNMRRL